MTRAAKERQKREEEALEAQTWAEHAPHPANLKVARMAYLVLYGAARESVLEHEVVKLREQVSNLGGRL